MSYGPYYPDDIQGWQVCQMEGCDGNGHCRRCGETNYRLLGYYGAIASAAKRWGVTKEEAERRMNERAEEQIAKWETQVQRLVTNLAMVTQ